MTSAIDYLTQALMTEIGLRAVMPACLTDAHVNDFYFFALGCGSGFFVLPAISAAVGRRGSGGW